MTELTAVARPYVEVLLCVARAGDLDAQSGFVSGIGQIAAVPNMRVAADDPKFPRADVAGIFLSTPRSPVSCEAEELIDLLVTSKYLSLPPGIATQFHVLQNISEGTTDVKTISAFPPEGVSLIELVTTLERKFDKKLQAHVNVDPSLIDSMHVQTGDEVPNTSVRVRLAQMQSTPATTQCCSVKRR